MERIKMKSTPFSLLYVPLLVFILLLASIPIKKPVNFLLLLNHGKSVSLESKTSTKLSLIRLGNVPLTPTPNFCTNKISIPYDKSHWKYFPLKNDVLKSSGDTTGLVVYKLAFDSQNKIWAATSDELLLIEDGKSSVIPMRTNLLSQTVNNVKIGQNGMIWISYKYHGKDNWVSSWNGKTEWHDYSFPGKIKDIDISKNGIVWVTYDSSDKSSAGVSFFQNQTWQNIRLGEDSLEDNKVLSTITSSDGSVWFETADSLFRLRNDSWQQYKFPIVNFNCDMWESPQRHFIEGPDGTIFGYIGFTIYHFDGNKWESYYGNHFSQLGLNGLAVSQNGKIWSGDGYILDDVNYYFSDLPFYMSYTIQEAPDESIWYGTDYGIYVYDNKGS